MLALLDNNPYLSDSSKQVGWACKMASGSSRLGRERYQATSCTGSRNCMV